MDIHGTFLDICNYHVFFFPPNQMLSRSWCFEIFQELGLKCPFKNCQVLSGTEIIF